MCHTQLLVHRSKANTETKLFACIPAAHLIEQVGIVHSCQRIAGTGPARNVCKVETVCKVHGLQDCEEEACLNIRSKWPLRDVHHKKNRVFEVIDRDAGFVASNDVDNSTI